jgi:dTDP-4-amino-4,6-dideoxygalactose transaminase
VSAAIPLVDMRPMTAEVRTEVTTAWNRLLDGGDFVRGEAVTRFEAEWAQYCGTSHAVGVANGTDAIWLTLRALGIGPGDDVVLPTNTFVATAEAVLQAGARPVFADVDPATLLLDAQRVRAVLTLRTRAVIAVHMFGQMPDMDALLAVTDAAGVMLIEDAAQAHGARWNGRRAGSYGVAGCFSFYPGKNLGAFGDGGAVVTSDDLLAERIRSLADHGRPANGHGEHHLVGFNSRLDTIQAAVLSAKLRHLDRWNHQRVTTMKLYRKLLDGTPARFLHTPRGSEPVYHLAVVQVPDRDSAREALRAYGIATGVHYLRPCHQTPPYAGLARGPLPVAEAAADRILSLPLFPGMTPAQTERVADALRCALAAVEVPA